MDFSKEAGNKVWAAFKDMKMYLDKSYRVLTDVDTDNYYTDSKGRKMYDGVSTLLNTNIGHCNRELIDAVSEQFFRLDNTTLFTTTNDVSLKCSEKLCELTGDHFYSCFFTNSGSEACDTAVKIVKKYAYMNGRSECVIVSLKGAYHGSNLTAMKLGQGQYENEQYFNDCSGYCQIDVPSLESSEEEIGRCIAQYEELIRTREVGAVFMELIQLSNGVNVLPESFVKKIYDISKANDVLVVVDEVATGFGRTGKMFASEHYGIKGDLMMFAKGVTSGYFPMGGVLAVKEVYEAFAGGEEKLLENGFTTGGHPVGCAAALKNIEIIEREKMSENSADMGEYLLGRMRDEIGSSFIVSEIRGKGLMLAILFNDYKIIGMPEFGIADILTNFAAGSGLLLYPDGPDTLIVAPVLNISREDCDKITDILKNCIGKLEKCVNRRDDK